MSSKLISDRKPITSLPALLPALAALIVLAGCGGNGEAGEAGPGGAPQRFQLALDFYVNPDHAGIYQGIADGDFARAGLDVEALVPSDPSAPIRQVAAGEVDLAISYEPELILAREQGLPVVAVGALVSQPLTSLISLPEAGVERAEDLAGKTVATAGIPYQAAFLEAILEDAGLSAEDVERVDVGFNLLPALLSGRADATLGGFLNVEGVDLELRGEDPKVSPVDELGIPTYDELVLVASEQGLTEDADSISAFLAALRDASRRAAEDPERATELVVEAGEGLEPALTGAEVERTLPLLAQEGERWGRMDPAEWQRFAAFLVERGLISEPPAADEMLSNELLPE